MPQCEYTTYVLKEHIPVVKKKLEKINNRSLKLGCEPLVLEIGEMTKNSKRILERGLYRAIDVPCYPVTIKGEIPKLSGWEFIGKISFDTISEGIVFDVPGKKVPEEFRNKGCICEHCNVNRKRDNVYIVKNEYDEYKQVGSSCLKDFLGHNPEKVVHVTESYFSFHSFCGLIDDEIVKYVVPLDSYIAYVLYSIEQEGWVSGKEAQEKGIRCTADKAYTLFTDGHDISDFDKYREKAQTQIEWAKNIKQHCGNDNLFHDIQNIAQKGILNSKLSRISALITPFYEKNNKPKKIFTKTDKENTPQSSFIGDKGERIEFLGTIKKTFASDYDPLYGSRYMHIIEDDYGNQYKWSSSKNFEKDILFSIKGTVKEHKEYKGVKQTIITRCVLEKTQIFEYKGV